MTERISLELLNGFKAVPHFEPPTVYRMTDGEIIFRGIVEPGPDPEKPIAVLPEGWRPEQDTPRAWDGEKTWWVTAAGEVHMVLGSGSLK